LEQETQNQEYCYNSEFGDAVCAFDNGIHCPERCEKCQRVFSDPERSTSVKVQIAVDQPIHEFRPMPFRQRFADAVAISVNAIEIELSAGSTIVDMKLSTVSGSDADAQTLGTRVAQTFPDSASAGTTLGVPVLSLTSTVAAASPVAPPAPPAPTPSPDAPPSPAAPSPDASPPPPSPASSDDDGNSTLFVIILASVAGALVLAVVVFVGCCMPGSNESQKPYSRPTAPPAVIVYAESAFDAKRGEYSKLA